MAKLTIIRLSDKDKKIDVQDGEKVIQESLRVAEISLLKEMFNAATKILQEKKDSEFNKKLFIIWDCIDQLENHDIEKAELDYFTEEEYRYLQSSLAVLNMQIIRKNFKSLVLQLKEVQFKEE